jgi:tetratricopeptide (TPR) repeat protein
MPHTFIVGACQRDRRQLIGPLAANAIIVSCHRNLRGPYSGVDELLIRILPEAYQRWPEMVDGYRTSLLETVPELSSIIGPPLPSLALTGSFEERTRFYSRQMVRCFSQGIVTLLREYAGRITAEGGVLPPLVFEMASEADPVGQSFLAILLRRLSPELWPVTVSGTDRLQTDLAHALVCYADRLVATGTPAPWMSSMEWAQHYVAADGAADEPEAQAAYDQLDVRTRQELHDGRAEELEQRGSWGIRVAALPYHRERGSDPSGAGVAALLEAAQHCTSIGLSESVIQLCSRGRALIAAHDSPVSYRKLSHLKLAALISTKRLDEALELAHELRRELAWPLVHMTTSYLIAMIYTRFMQPRDHETAMEWQNNALIIAQQLPDPRERLVLTGFQENGMALIEMHRGHLDRALELVENAANRLDEELEPDEWALHRSQLLYNRTRLLSAMGRTAEAYENYGRLIEWDPQYTDYLSERAKLARKRGDLVAAISDYDRAAQIGAPFPEVYHNRGSAYAELGDTESALANFDFVLDMEPDDVESRLSRAEVLLGAGRLTEAAIDVEHALVLRQDDVRLRCLRGMIRLAQEAPAAAIADFDAALTADPSYPAALANRAVAHYELGHYDAAVADLTGALASTGEDSDLLLNRGIAHAAAGNRSQAEEDFARALTLPGADHAEIQAQRRECLTSA